ncbi:MULTISPECIES: biopolymer transporter ExbD [Sporomusa]|jgi:biopolymer transport protein ExbD|uniref:Biopolymer transport protein ExbD n=2 Tax=Sporomusa TaxID=2375 RepID=A0ABM9W232_9FIRM|nr:MULTISPECIES: biopolymer transporter ExbD [Sporomusa]MCM0760549.1 biopolymer transporter ExbD [Sporomusa sphaeroides DSM 2875]OLS57135.1 biopolymer transport protein ExbD [Sporomusa sphaeroides DSM 2875]CVK18321.1 biopolymer transport protein ExbD [Sporomusa sphaeroides DSM 2875]SCM81575.1 Biopolymer transport protein ExbD/TolR [uncultured Sporomusa sp.]HML31773.1 biopolymer transporter ExbD [Sporomusa sphaeroides]
MRLRSLRVAEQPQLMIIPMIDIIFFLLVFFMMSTLYMVEQHTMPVSLPQAAAVQQDTQRNITVTVTKDGRILFEQEELPLTLLKKRVGMEIAGQPDKVFVLRADKQVEYGQVINVLDELKMAGARRVAVAAETKAR